MSTLTEFRPPHVAEPEPEPEPGLTWQSLTARPGSSGRWAWLLVAVFLVVFGVHARSDVRISGDSLWSIHTSLSLIREHNLDLDEYPAMLDRQDRAYTHERGGHRYNDFPIGVSIFAVPFVYVVDRLAYFLLNVDFRDYIDHTIPTNLESLIAAFATALTAVFVAMIGRRQTGSVAGGLILAGVFAFGTAAWSSASRGLGQHGPSMLMLAITLYLLMRAEERPWLAAWASLPLGFAYIIRPTNSLSILVFTVYVALVHRRWLALYALGGLSLAVPFVLYSRSIYGVLLPVYYWPQRLGASPTFFEALAGNLVSPARGLFVYSPVYLLAVGEAAYRLARRQVSRLEVCVAAIVLLHWVSIASFPHWWAGWAIGPRFFSDVLPFLTFLLGPVVGALLIWRGPRRLALASALALTTLVSVAINWHAATSYAPYQWNGEPADVDLAPARLWDWRDPPFWRQ